MCFYLRTQKPAPPIEVFARQAWEVTGQIRDAYAPSDLSILAEFVRFAIPNHNGVCEMTKSPSSIESAILSVYECQDSAVEPILTTVALRSKFVRDVQDLVPDASEDDVLCHLVRLRKRGQDKGGLPRKTK